MSPLSHDILEEAHALAGDIVAHLAATAPVYDDPEEAPGETVQENPSEKDRGEEIKRLQEEGEVAYGAGDMYRLEEIMGIVKRLGDEGAAYIDEHIAILEKQLQEQEENFTGPQASVTDNDLEKTRADIADWYARGEAFGQVVGDAEMMLEGKFNSLSHRVSPQASGEAGESVTSNLETESVAENTEDADTAPWQAVGKPEDADTLPQEPISAVLAPEEVGVQAEPMTAKEFFALGKKKVREAEEAYLRECDTAIAQYMKPTAPVATPEKTDGISPSLAEQLQAIMNKHQL